MPDTDPAADPSSPDVPDKHAPEPADQPDPEDTELAGEDLAPPPANATPPAEAGQPEGDVKPESDGPTDPQSSPDNQELQRSGSAPAQPDETAPDTGSTKSDHDNDEG